MWHHLWRQAYPFYRIEIINSMLLFIVLLVDLLLLSSFTDTGFCSFVWHNEYIVYGINEGN